MSEDGSTCEWGKVLAYDPPERPLLAWQIDAAWKCDPDFVTEVDVLFKAKGGGTRVELEPRNLERFGAKAATVADKVGSDSGLPLILGLYAKGVGA